MNIRKGAVRIGILLVPYLGWWGWQGWSAHQSIADYEALRLQALSREDYDGESAWFYAIQDARGTLEESWLWGAYVPAGAIGACLIGYWLYRGFTSKT